MALCWVMWPGRSSKPPADINPGTGKDMDKTVKMSADHDWSSLSESSMREMTHQLDHSRKLVNSDFDALVKIGESVVTSGHEPSPGVFVFSTLTPTIATSQNGSPTVQVTIETTQIDIEGKVKALSGYTVAMQKGGSRDVTTLSNGRTFDISLSAVPDRSNPKVIHMRSRESSQANSL